MFRSYIGASVLVMVAVPLHEMTDGVLLGHAVTPDALSLIALLVPLNTIFFAIKMVFVTGNSIIAAKAFGARENRRMCEVFTVAITSQVTVIAALVALAYIFLPQFTSLFCQGDETLYPMLYKYLQVILLQFPILAISSAFDDFFRLSGRAKLVSRATVASCLANVVLTYVFLFVFDMGIRGAALATIICVACSKLLYVPCLRRGEFPFRFVKMDVQRYFSILREGIQTGAPLSVMQILVAVTFYVTNSVILKFQGPDGMFLWSVVLQVLSVCQIVAIGFNGVTQHIGSMLLGEDDFEGYRMLVGKSFFWCAMLAAIIVCLGVIFPDVLVSFFGEDNPGGLPHGYARHLGLGILMIFPFIISGFLTTAMTVVGKAKVATLFNVLTTVAIMLCAVAGSLGGSDNFWFLLPVTETLILLALFAVTFFIHRRNDCYSAFALMPLFPNDVSMLLEPKYDNSNIGDTLRGIRMFVELADLDERQSFSARVCCEGLVDDIVGSEENQPGESFEMRLIDKPDRIIVITKELGARRGWNYFDTDDSMNTRLLRGFSTTLSYGYYNGVSVTTMSLSKDARPTPLES